MTEIKIKDWELYYNSPTKKQVYSAIWWANKQGKLDFAEKKGGAWVINQDAFEEYYKQHGQMGIERVDSGFSNRIIIDKPSTFEIIKPKSNTEERLKNITEMLDGFNRAILKCNTRLDKMQDTNAAIHKRAIESDLKANALMRKFGVGDEVLQEDNALLENVKETAHAVSLLKKGYNEQVQKHNKLETQHKGLVDKHNTLVDGCKKMAEVNYSTWKALEARQEALANQHQAYKAVVEVQGRRLGELAAKQQEIEKKLESLDPLWVQFVVGIVGGLISPIIVGLFAWLIWG